MKIDRHRPSTRPSAVKLAAPTFWRPAVLCLIALLAGCSKPTSSETASSQSAAAARSKLDAKAAGNQPRAQTVSNRKRSRASDKSPTSQPQATALLRKVLHEIAHGPAFDAKVRETVWTTGREVVGVGTYQQAGGGSGRFNLQITMHDGDGKHRLQQISDGRLAWTRNEIAGHVSLRRVDVGRLDEWLRHSARAGGIAPRLRIGGWTEMLDTIDRDYIVRVDPAKLHSRPVWVITGTLRKDVRTRVLAESGRQQWPLLLPTKVCVAVAATADPETNFGQLLPVRIEYWSDPVASAGSADDQPKPKGRLLTLIELYSIQPIAPPPIERFRFENLDAEVNFTNETERYIKRYGVQITAAERRLLRR